MEDKREKMLEERAKYIERTKNILVFDNMEEEKPRKSGKVNNCIWFLLASGILIFFSRENIKFMMAS